MQKYTFNVPEASLRMPYKEMKASQAYALMVQSETVYEFGETFKRHPVIAKLTSKIPYVYLHSDFIDIFDETVNSATKETLPDEFYLSIIQQVKETMSRVDLPNTEEAHNKELEKLRDYLGAEQLKMYVMANTYSFGDISATSVSVFIGDATRTLTEVQQLKEQTPLVYLELYDMVLIRGIGEEDIGEVSKALGDAIGVSEPTKEQEAKERRSRFKVLD